MAEPKLTKIIQEALLLGMSPEELKAAIDVAVQEQETKGFKDKDKEEDSTSIGNKQASVETSKARWNNTSHL